MNGQTAPLVIDRDVAIHADVDLNASSSVGDPSRVGLELEVVIADADGVVGCNGPIELEGKQGIRIDGAGQFAIGRSRFGGLDPEALIKARQKLIQDLLGLLRGGGVP